MSTDVSLQFYQPFRRVTVFLAARIVPEKGGDGMGVARGCSPQPVPAAGRLLQHHGQRPGTARGHSNVRSRSRPLWERSGLVGIMPEMAPRRPQGLRPLGCLRGPGNARVGTRGFEVPSSPNCVLVR